MLKNSVQILWFSFFFNKLLFPLRFEIAFEFAAFDLNEQNHLIMTRDSSIPRFPLIYRMNVCWNTPQYFEVFVHNGNGTFEGGTHTTHERTKSKTNMLWATWVLKLCIAVEPLWLHKPTDSQPPKEISSTLLQSDVTSEVWNDKKSTFIF